jgi:hypothetical protein
MRNPEVVCSWRKGSPHCGHQRMRSSISFCSGAMQNATGPSAFSEWTGWKVSGQGRQVREVQAVNSQGPLDGWDLQAPHTVA